MVHFHFQSMATALGARRWNIAEQIKFILIARDPLESTEQVIGVVDGETPRALCKRLQDLLIGGGRRRHLGQDRARRIVRIVVVVVVRRIDRPRSAASPAASRSAGASGSPALTAACSPSASGSAALTAAGASSRRTSTRSTARPSA